MTAKGPDLGAFGIDPAMAEGGGWSGTADKYDAPGLVARYGPRQFHVMAKPAGAACNLDCIYCFYLSKATLPGAPARACMSDAVLKEFIRQYIEGITGDEVIFSWQGGEPTLLGLDFFRKVVALEAQFARPGQRIENDLQTNGVLLDDEWCRFLKEHRFLVGLSLDGPREIHDRCRVTKGGEPTFDKVFAAARLLKRYGVPFNTLSCIHRYNARRPLDVYRFLRREVGALRGQFIPIVEHRGFERTAPQTWDPAKLPCDGDPRARPGRPDSVVTDWSVDPDDWGYFLCKIFDEWRNRDIGKFYVNLFETLVAQHMGMPSQVCVYSELCGKGLALENEGSLYACDHYVYPEYCRGNIMQHRLGDLVFTRAQVKFAYAKHETLPSQCRACAYLRDCWGECPKNRIIRTAEGEPGLNYLCRGFKQFFAHAIPEVDRIVKRLRNRPPHGRGLADDGR
jgi:uncharacterized protein